MPHFRLRNAFFDTDTILKSVGIGTIAGLSKAGAYLRHTARGLIRHAKKPAKPGKPPHGHTDMLKNHLFFAYDASTDSVYVGPEKTNQVFFNGDGRPVTGTVPDVLEHGGDISILEVQRDSGKWVRADLRSKRRLAGKKTRLRTVHIEARPTMSTALKLEQDKLPEMFKNCVKP